MIVVSDGDYSIHWDLSSSRVLDNQGTPEAIDILKGQDEGTWLGFRVDSTQARVHNMRAILNIASAWRASTVHPYKTRLQATA